jgi:hypothetical protein
MVSKRHKRRRISGSRGGCASRGRSRAGCRSAPFGLCHWPARPSRRSSFPKRAEPSPATHPISLLRNRLCLISAWLALCETPVDAALARLQTIRACGDQGRITQNFTIDYRDWIDSWESIIWSSLSLCLRRFALFRSAGLLHSR